MISGWVLWYAHVDRTTKFSESMAIAYPVLASPEDQAQARILLTDANEEAQFLRFSQNLSDLEQGLRQYTNITSVCGELIAQAIVSFFAAAV